MYYTYMLRCSDGSIYTGIATDLEKRMQEHFKKSKNCAKYTMTHNAKRLEASWKSEDRVLASKLEFCIKKRLTKEEKEKIIYDNVFFTKIINEKIKEIDSKKEYERVSNTEILRINNTIDVGRKK